MLNFGFTIMRLFGVFLKNNALYFSISGEKVFYDNPPHVKYGGLLLLT